MIFKDLKKLKDEILSSFKDVLIANCQIWENAWCVSGKNHLFIAFLARYPAFSSSDTSSKPHRAWEANMMSLAKKLALVNFNS